MVRIAFIEHDGTQHDVEAPQGWSLMEAAVKNGVPGIDGDCGGACACATCHVFVQAPWFDKVGERSPNEQEMLEFSAEVADNSRLACQITLAPALDGITVRMPASQQ
ncbi:MAG: hypothetical protein RLZZ444_994 [Pseudomonadota bacterium]|jgi:2Fe-2S ferredoxin|uniref:2Fe-2S iron-sulfur cluster-binding protein n=1 Tax=unclassified Novosphingobium TaxID=2644732 RepID=UPI0003B4EF3A|nr:2Fe-2S iron-sulfur cluster-binding protein [Novosphingobium sp. B-7]